MLNMKMTTEEQITTLDVDLHDFKGRSRSRMDRKIIDAEQGWEYMLQGITKLKKILEGSLEPNFSSKEYIMLYTTIYNMCTQKPPNDHSQQLYDKFKDAFHEYIKSTVLPSIKEKHDEFMLRELVQRWANHKVMDYGSIFPHLVVAPLSTLGNWEREFATWVPQMNVVMYVGFAQARTVIKKSSKKSCWKQAGHDQI